VPRKIATALLACSALGLASAPASALEGVVTSIKPVHSLVAGVMQGVAEPTLIVQGAGSPHTYALRPSEAAALEGASVVFWVGEGMENFLAGPLETLAGEATVVELAKAHDLVTLDYRSGGPFEAHDHDDHAHGDDAHGQDHAHDDHAHGDDHAHAHEGESHEGHSHEEGHDHAHEEAGGHDHGHDQGHAHGAHDMHLWLDPQNAKAFVHEIEETLSRLDPDNAETYAANAEALEARLDALIEETNAALEPVRDRRFIVFHDAYQYFENRFGLTAAGSITVSPEAIPGAQRVAEIKARVEELGATCVFAEPQFEPRLVQVVTEGTPARAGVLDPLGADLADGPELYFELIGNMSSALTTCLAESG
jgi:zinc transport system substrate-binding protein